MATEANFFLKPQKPIHAHYEALRAFYVNEFTAEEVAKEFGYKASTVYALARDFKKILRTKKEAAYHFFQRPQLGRRRGVESGETEELIIGLRKQYLSVSEIKGILDSLGRRTSERQVYNIIKKEGFTRLPRRSSAAKKEATNNVQIEAAKSELLEFTPEDFTSEGSIGILCMIPLIRKLGIDKLIEESNYPGTKTIPTLNSILCFIALKLSNVNRYTADDLWCMDRGLGLFAGLNVLPKAAWFTSYSHRVKRETNLEFLKSLSKIWQEQGLLSDTANLDFTTIPYWGEDDSHLENNWSGTRARAMPSILAALAHDPESGIITYGDTGIRHDNKSEVILEFLDFYNSAGDEELKYLVFDSKFTTYEHLANLDDSGIKFITIRRRGKSIVEQLNQVPDSEKKRVRVPAADGKKRLLTVVDQVVYLKAYGDNIRQISITGTGRVKPALIITNDFELSVEQVVRKYAKRWIVEKTISEQIEFFHLNRLSSSMVIKVDFDLTMSILAHNLYRVFADELDGYENSTAVTLFRKFIRNSGNISIQDDVINIKLKKKRHLPLILTAMHRTQEQKIHWLGERKFNFQGASYS